MPSLWRMYLCYRWTHIELSLKAVVSEGEGVRVQASVSEHERMQGSVSKCKGLSVSECEGV
jgi:hypothetical protein